MVSEQIFPVSTNPPCTGIYLCYVEYRIQDDELDQLSPKGCHITDIQIEMKWDAETKQWGDIHNILPKPFEVHYWWETKDISRYSDNF